MKEVVIIMAHEEIVNATIDMYMNLQRIKKANGGHDNPELDDQIKGVISNLSSLGVNVEDITL